MIDMSEVKAYGVQASDANLKELNIERRQITADDVQIEIEYCGVCHSDIHQVRNDWKNSKYPVVPGHEIIGRVTQVGKNVSNFKEGDKILLPPHGNTPVSYKGDIYHVFREISIFAKING